MSIRSYIICTTPRSGSTLLCDLMTGTGVAGCPASYYRHQSIREWASRLGVEPVGTASDAAFDRAYLDAVLRHGSGDTGIFGLRLMWESVADLSRRLDRVFPGRPDDVSRFERALGPTAYVQLSREDKVAQAVSHVKALQTGLWHVAADGSERQRTMPHRPPHYDVDRLAACVAELEDEEAAWARWFAQQGIVPVRITYEALAADPGSVIAGVLAALGLDPTSAAGVEPQTAKMADSESRAWAARFRAERG